MTSTSSIADTLSIRRWSRQEGRTMDTMIALRRKQRQPSAAELEQLARTWLDAEQALTDWRESAPATAERLILQAIGYANKAGELLLIDDLHAALSHVDGCAAACAKQRDILRDNAHKAAVALSAAGFNPLDEGGLSDLMSLLEDAGAEPATISDLDVRLASMLTRLREWAE